MSPVGPMFGKSELFEESKIRNIERLLSGFVVATAQHPLSAETRSVLREMGEDIEALTERLEEAFDEGAEARYSRTPARWRMHLHGMLDRATASRPE